MMAARSSVPPAASSAAARRSGAPPAPPPGRHGTCRAVRARYAGGSPGVSDLDRAPSRVAGSRPPRPSGRGPSAAFAAIARSSPPYVRSSPIAHIRSQPAVRDLEGVPGASDAVEERQPGSVAPNAMPFRPAKHVRRWPGPARTRSSPHRSGRSGRGPPPRMPSASASSGRGVDRASDQPRPPPRPGSTRRAAPPTSGCPPDGRGLRARAADGGRSGMSRAASSRAVGGGPSVAGLPQVPALSLAAASRPDPGRPPGRRARSRRRPNATAGPYSPMRTAVSAPPDKDVDTVAGPVGRSSDSRSWSSIALQVVAVRLDETRSCVPPRAPRQRSRGTRGGRLRRRPSDTPAQPGTVVVPGPIDRHPRRPDAASSAAANAGVQPGALAGEELVVDELAQKSVV